MTKDDEVDESDGQPEWMELIRPPGIIERSEEFTYDDGGIDHDWTHTSLEYAFLTIYTRNYKMTPL